jgi:hypothetical protein
MKRLKDIWFNMRCEFWHNYYNYKFRHYNDAVCTCGKYWNQHKPLTDDHMFVSHKQSAVTNSYDMKRMQMFGVV